MKIGLIGIDTLKNKDQFLLIKDALQSKLFGLFSPHADILLPLTNEHNIKPFNSATELFSKVGAIYFANSLKPNYNFAVSAIKKSCHIFIEDISSLSFDEIKYLYKLAFEARINIQLRLTKSFTPEYTTLKDSINNCKFIEFTHGFNNFVRKENYFNIILNNLYLAYQHINSDIKKIATFVLPVGKNHYSLVDIRLEFNNGTVVSLKIENISANVKNKAIFYQPEKVVSINFIKHDTTKRLLEPGNTEQEIFSFEEQNALQYEINYFTELCKNDNSQHISESPIIFKIIKATQDIIQYMSQLNKHL